MCYSTIKKIAYLSSVFIFFSFTLAWPSDKEKASELRGQYKKTYEKYKELKEKSLSTSKVEDHLFNERLEEFKKQQAKLQQLEKPIKKLTGIEGQSLMWAPRARRSVRAVVNASSFNCGPNDSVIPFNGEYTETVTDLSSFQRGGLGFNFVRNYSSFSDYDCGLGIGWDHNFNIGILSPDGYLDKSNNFVLFLDGREIQFTKIKNNWTPEAGEFFQVEIIDNKVNILTPSLMRYEFEPSQEKADENEQNWRISAIASRHDSWRANRIEIKYLNNSDRIEYIADPFDEKVFFTYDQKGHIVQILKQNKAITFAYNEFNLLTQINYPSSMLSLSQSSDNQISYYYKNINPHWQLSKKVSIGLPFSFEVTYDDKSRVEECGYISKEISQLWRFTYSDKKTVIRSPSPDPEVHIFFGSPIHPSLPTIRSIPSQKADWSYLFNSDNLLIEEKKPIGNRKIYIYDSKNPNILMKCNLLFEKELPANDYHADWQEFGVETIYDKRISLPVSAEFYQITKEGDRQIIKREITSYSDKDFMPIIYNDGGIETRMAYNNYGEIGLLLQKNDCATIFYYSEKLPQTTIYAFQNGNPNNSGVLVKKIEDATLTQIKDACTALGIEPILRNEITRVSPVALETMTVWDINGNEIWQKVGYDQTLSLFSNSGDLLANYESATGLKIFTYLPSQKIDHIKHEFCPTKENKLFQGDVHTEFNGRFYTESFIYDSLLSIKKHFPTNEPFGEIIPFFLYDRLPNGRVASITNPAGVKRLDIYDAKTGWLIEKKLYGNQNEKQGLTLASKFEYYQDGNIKQYIDEFGGIRKNLLNGFGQIYASVNPLGVISQNKFDSLGRMLEKCDKFEDKELSHTNYFYSEKNGLLESVTTLQIENELKKPIETSRYIFDEVGNTVGEKGSHQESWTYFLLDGLNNKIATINPSGDVSVNVFDKNKLIFSSSSLYSGSKKSLVSNSYIFDLDYEGRVVKETPIDSKNELIFDRVVETQYNRVGQVVCSITKNMTTKEFVYDSQSRIIKELLTPFSIKQGEKPEITTYEYFIDGKLSKKTVSNYALALFGTSEKSRPELVDAPQQLTYQYDEYNRLLITTQPDGLILSNKYNQFSQPELMVWTHISEPNKILRSLKLVYSNLGQATHVLDASDNRLLREYQYDNYGNCIRSIDHGDNDSTVVLNRQFNSIGLMIEEGVSLDKHVLPIQQFNYNLEKGLSTMEWQGLTIPNSTYWSSETYSADGSSRLLSLALDKKKAPFSTWQYMGNLIENRIIAESGIENSYTYNELNEPVQQLIKNTESGKKQIGVLNYSYGPQGQAEFSSTSVSDRNDLKYTYAQYAQFDSYRRLVAQNGEIAIPLDSERQKRYHEVFGAVEDSLYAQCANRSIYDQASNVWVKYSGNKVKEFIPSAFSTVQTASFTSSAPVLSDVPTNIGDLSLRELASNRETTKASLNEKKEGLVSKEYIYDKLGNLVEFEGDYWNGQLKYPVKWSLKFDLFGRLVKMTAISKKEVGYAKVDDKVAELFFQYDAENRRVSKRVADYTRGGQKNDNITYTVNSGNNQSLVFKQDGEKLKLIEQYLWNPGTREFLMASLPESIAENEKSGKVSRYYFHLNSVIVMVISVVFSLVSDF